MPACNHDDFDPPAPVALVDTRDRATGETITHIPMSMDTGADVTLVPLASLDHLQG
jgi:hypothetical protein